MDALMKLLESVPGAMCWVDGEREIDHQKVMEDNAYLAMLSSGEKARVYLWAQLWNGYTPDLLREESWNLHRALNHLDQEGQVCFVRTLQRVWGIPR